MKRHKGVAPVNVYAIALHVLFAFIHAIVPFSDSPCNSAPLPNLYTSGICTNAGCLTSASFSLL